MANEVYMKTECVHIKKGGIDLIVKRGGKTFGTLTVSNATLSWFPSWAKKSIDFDWPAFDRFVKAVKEEK